MSGLQSKPYGGFQLRKGDSDKGKIWGGVRRPNVPHMIVEALQRDLIAVGVMDIGVDGSYGGKTNDAVKRFQWNAKQIKSRVVGARLVRVATTYTGMTSGIVDEKTANELLRWTSHNYFATGDLVRVDLSKLSNFQVTKSFVKKLPNFTLGNNEMVVSAGLLQAVGWMNTAATANSLKVSVNQGIRVSGQKVKGAVVKPASKSQHLIGHAIDCNLITKDKSWNSSKTFKDKKEHKDATSFIEAVKGKGLRWGGDFGGGDRKSKSFDPIHFDLQISWKLPAYGYKFYFNQRSYALRHPLAIGNLGSAK